MNKSFYLLFVVTAIVVSTPVWNLAGELQTIKLNEPNRKREIPLMEEALSVKASAVERSDKELGMQDLSDLAWAANGITLPAEKKSTASSTQNAHDVDIYIFMKEGVYIYDIYNHELNPVLSGDFRSQLMIARPPRHAGVASPGPENAPRTGVVTPPSPPLPSNPPIQIILASDSERFRMGPQELRYEWGAIDAGIVSKNISLFCAVTGMKTRPRASFDKEKINNFLKLKDSQYVFLNHPVGYQK